MNRHLERYEAAVSDGRSDDALETLCIAVSKEPALFDAVRSAATRAMNSDEFELSLHYARALTRMRWGKASPSMRTADDAIRPQERFISARKLDHDIEQYKTLLGAGLIDDGYQDYVSRLGAIRDRIKASSHSNSRFLLDEDSDPMLRSNFNRIAYHRSSDRVPAPFSGRWSGAGVQSDYRSSTYGIAIIDDFLSEEALHELQTFCAHSTVWFANRYARGRLGAFFHDGFNSPLLTQIAKGLKQELPDLLTGHPLTQLWGFKYGSRMPEESTLHADFAAVNVNFWITPDHANEDPKTGGLTVYLADAPPHWAFDIYNGRSDLIRSFLSDVRAEKIDIPYRENRAVIFNSDLFHSTAKMEFVDQYLLRRVNVTMLYGQRGNEASINYLEGAGVVRPSRSAAFRRQ